jgi:hypothetical protein
MRKGTCASAADVTYTPGDPNIKVARRFVRIARIDPLPEYLAAQLGIALRIRNDWWVQTFATTDIEWINVT